MTVGYTVEQVTALAPDGSSAKAGRGLALAAHWVTTGRNERAVWGECRGSGKKPYQVEIELGEQPAFKCSCPSRKFPCKHALGLMFLLAGDAAGIEEGTPPPWVTEWLESRLRRAQKKEERKERAAGPADPKAQEKRVERRRERIAAGLADLDLWLRDLVRGGLAAAQPKPHSYWATPAARLVDAQAPGLARWIEAMEGAAHSGEGWEDRLLHLTGRVALIVEGFSRFDSLPPGTQADLRTAIGWPLEKEEVLAGDGAVSDRWAVLGQSVEEQGRLREQRVWLRGAGTGRPALILNFAYANQPLDISLVPGTTVEADLCFYPGNFPLRALVKERRGNAVPLDGDGIPGYGTWDEALGAFSEAFTANPWMGRFPLGLLEVRPRHSASGWVVCDIEGRELALGRDFRRPWDLLAVSGGRPLSLFGEWNESTFRPLSGWADGRFYSWPFERVSS